MNLMVLGFAPSAEVAYSVPGGDMFSTAQTRRSCEDLQRLEIPTFAVLMLAPIPEVVVDYARKIAQLAWTDGALLFSMSCWLLAKASYGSAKLAPNTLVSENFWHWMLPASLICSLNHP